MPTAKVYIHGGDYDCSELVRMCYRAVEILPYGSYMWTGNEVSLLKQYGFKECGIRTPPRIGDVLWRNGHTELYLDGGYQGGARISEHGTVNGTKGDQTGTEITKSTYKASNWSKILRYDGGNTINGIPCYIAAALVCEHIIEHSAHGYSQPNRKGDGTIEAITISWDGKAVPSDISMPESTLLSVAFSNTFKMKGANIRDYPSTTKGAITGFYGPNENVIIDGLVINEDRLWGTYIGASSGKRRYVALAKFDLAEIVR